METKAVNSLVEPYLIDFAAEFEDLFKRNSRAGKSFLFFLESRLKQSRVYNSEAEDILYECFFRGRAYIASHKKEIKNVKAWARATCLNIIKEKVRANIRAERIIEKLKESKQFSCLDNFEDDQASKRIWRTLNSRCLSPSDRQLLLDRFFMKMSISEIQEKLILQGENVKVNTLSQRISRALKRFRKIYEDMD